MNLHKNARMTPHSRILMVRRVLDQKQPATRVAADVGVSERTVRKWLARWRVGGRGPRRARPLPRRRGARVPSSSTCRPNSPDLNLIEQALAKRDALLRTAASRTSAALWQAIGYALDAFAPAECAHYLAHAGYVPSNREGLWRREQRGPCPLRPPPVRSNATSVTVLGPVARAHCAAHRAGGGAKHEGDERPDGCR